MAKRHFSPDDDDFDFETFDLYCEIGADQSIVTTVLARLQLDIKVLGADNATPGIMLTDDLRPALLRKYERIADIRTGFQRTIRKLNEKSHDGEEKQRLLDVASKTAKGASRKSQEPSAKATVRDESPLTRARRDWRIGSVMLGSAAEQLVGQTKQELASSLILLGSQIIDLQTRAHARVNFDELRADVLASSEVERFMSLFKEESERQEMRELIQSLLDLFEFALLGQPFISTLNYLCEQSRHRVLATSVEKATVTGAQEQMMRAAWLADLDGRKGKSTLMDSISGLPPAPFFRIVLTSHFLHRVYWTQWRKEDREALLEAAEATMKTLGMSLKKGEMMRIIGREPAKDNLEDEIE